MYFCENLAVKEEYGKEKYRNRPDDQRSKGRFRVATCQVYPDINISVTNKQNQFPRQSSLFFNSCKQWINDARLKKHRTQIKLFIFPQVFLIRIYYKKRQE